MVLKLWFLTHALIRNYTVSSLVHDSRDIELPLIWLKIARNNENWFKNYLLELTAIYFMQFRGKNGFPNTKISRFLLRISTRVYGISAGVGPLGQTTCIPGERDVKTPVLVNWAMESVVVPSGYV